MDAKSNKNYMAAQISSFTDNHMTQHNKCDDPFTYRTRTYHIDLSANIYGPCLFHVLVDTQLPGDTEHGDI